VKVHFVVATPKIEMNAGNRKLKKGIRDPPKISIRAPTRRMSCAAGKVCQIIPTAPYLLRRDNLAYVKMPETVQFFGFWG
jgi:hypothetical protein